LPELAVVKLTSAKFDVCIASYMTDRKPQQAVPESLAGLRERLALYDSSTQFKRSRTAAAAPCSSSTWQLPRFSAGTAAGPQL